MKMKKLKLSDFLKSELSGYTESDLTELYVYYETHPSNANTIRRFMQEIDRLAYVASAPSVIEFIRHGQVIGNATRVVNGNLCTDMQTKFLYQITEADAGTICNLRMKCFTVAGYIPYDEKALQKYRKIKSYNCFCPDKRCMSLLKNISPPKHVIDRDKFDPSERGLVDRMNTSLLDQYYDAPSVSERRTVSRAFNRIEEAKNKIRIFKSMYPNGDPLGTYTS